ncbi:MAG: hypothetical protein DRO06_02885 [Thermoproteota archaeon]|nr:MAG: hypothetical protein DRO06_02885 [Candidatus Korarchaeota archaeon]
MPGSDEFVDVEVRPPRPSAGLILKALAIILIIVLLFSSVYTVDLGYAAVVVDPITGYVSDTPVVGPRIGFKLPWQAVKHVYVAVDGVHMWTDITAVQSGYGAAVGDYPAIEALTKDSLRAWVDITVLWVIDPGRAPDIVRAFPDLDYDDKLVLPVIREVVRDIIAEYKAAEVAEKRVEISQRIQTELQRELDADPRVGGAFSITEVTLRNIRLPDQFMEAIQEKLAAQQRMIAADYERNRTLVLANASAQARIIEAQGAARARLIEANATASAIDMIAEVGGNRSQVAALYVLLQNLAKLQNGTRVLVIVSPREGVPILYPVEG